MSGGILGSGLPQGQGILGGAGSGFFDQVGQAFADNSGLLMGYGAGGFDGAMQGMQQDERTRAIKLKEAQEQQKKIAAQQWAQKNGLDPALASDPDTVFAIAQSTALNKLQQGAPTEIQRNLSALGLKAGTDEYKAAYMKLSGLGKPSASWGVIGKDDFGNERYGWIDPTTQTTTPGAGYQTPPQVAQSDGPAIPPAPPGVNPKIWRDKQTEALATQGKPTTEMTNKLAGAEKSAADLNNSLDNYNALVQKYGAEAWNGPAKAQMQSAYTDVLIKMKEAANLGVLNGPDLELMQKQLEEAAVTGIDRVNPFASAKAFGIEGRVGAQVGQIKKSVNQGVENARRVYGGKQPSASQAVKGTTRNGLSWSAN